MLTCDFCGRKFPDKQAYIIMEDLQLKAVTCCEIHGWYYKNKNGLKGMVKKDGLA